MKKRNISNMYKRVFAFVLAFTMAVGMVPATALAETENPKISADSMTVSASSVDETEPAHNKDPKNVLDSTNTTFWATVPGGTLEDAWLKVEFDKTYVINQVNYTMRYDSGAIWNCTGNLQDYIVEVSMDDVEWTVAATGNTAEGTTVIAFDAVQANYIRLRATQSYHWQDASRNTVMTVADLDVFGVEYVPETPIVVDKSALHAAIKEAKEVDSAYYDNYDAVANALDRAEALAADDTASKEDVDSAAAALKAAVEALVLKDADYSKVEAAIEAANALRKEDYVDFSAVEAAIEAVVEGKKITEQAEVDAMAKTIEDAVAALDKKGVLTIVQQPMNVEGLTGETAEVTVLAQGDGLIYTWYYKNPGNKKFYASGENYVNGNTYSIQLAKWRDGQEVYCVITDAYGDSVQTDTVNLSIRKADAELVAQPEDVVVETLGDTATVTVDAEGENLTYTWYYKNPGNVKFYVSDDQFVTDEGKTYTIPVAAWRDGQEVYCVITDASGATIQTNTVTLSVAK